MKKKIISVILAAVMLFSCVAVSAETQGETASRYLNAILKAIADNYKYGVDKEELYKAVASYLIEKNPEDLEGAFKAATDILDDYSVYYNSSELSSFVTNVHQEYIGIGITVQKNENGCLVVEVNKNGGAYDAGVLVGDEITAINGISIKDKTLEDIVAMIKGEAGTTVSLDILRNEAHLMLDILRKKITVQTVSYEIMDEVGYIKINTFASNTPEELKAALNKIEKVYRLKKIIIDVRDNPGGELASVIKILNQFVPKGKTLVKFEYKQEINNYEVKSKAAFTNKPNRKIVILANSKSASASELFSGTMQYYKLATVLGEYTFGKGSMQDMLGIINPDGFDLGDIKLTMAEFLKPDGGKINGVGIKPDVAVKNKFKDFDESVLTPMTISGRYTIGDEHDDVLAIEERLSALGYNVGKIDGLYDNLTYQATMNFQATMGLHPYGVMDYTTQSALNDVIEDMEVEIDIQLERALEILK